MGMIESNEQKILGIMCQDQEMFHNGVEELEVEDFADKKCLSIFVALCEIAKSGAMPTVGEIAVRCPDIEREEILNYFTEYGIIGDVFYSQYLREIRRDRVNRVIKSELPAIQNRASNGEIGAADLLESLVEKIQGIDIGGEEMTLTDKVLSDAFLSMGEKTEKVRTGFVDFDKVLGGGYGRGTLNAIGGRPSMGKSTLAMNIAINVLLENEKENVVAYFTLEETVKAFLRRVYLHLAKCSLEQVQSGDMKAVNHVMNAQDELYKARDRFLVMHLPGAKVGRISALCRKFKARKKHIDLIVIDYLTLLDLGMSKNKPLNQAIGDITKALKALASEMDAPVLLLCQLNRDSEKDGEPGMSSFKDSGNIEQDVDTAIALYRPKTEEVPDQWQDEEERRIPPNAKIVKNRDGGYGTIPLAWMPSCYTFACVYKGDDVRE